MLAWHGAARAQEPTLPEFPVPEIVVTGSTLGISDTASQGTVSGAQLEERPAYRVGELLESVPGLIVTQHSGEGKANQYFLRGFNLDHGTDIDDHARRHAGQHAHPRARPGLCRSQFHDPRADRRAAIQQGTLFRRPGRLRHGRRGRRSIMSMRCRTISPWSAPERSAIIAGSARSRVLWGRASSSLRLEYVHADGPWTSRTITTRATCVLNYSQGNARERVLVHRHVHERRLPCHQSDPAARRRRGADLSLLPARPDRRRQLGALQLLHQICRDDRRPAAQSQRLFIGYSSSCSTISTAS